MKEKKIIPAVPTVAAIWCGAKKKGKHMKKNKVKCKDCKHLMFSDCYGECKKGILGIVSPEDSCGEGERKMDSGKKERWIAANRLINTVRQAKGLPLRPSYEEVMKKRKEEKGGADGQAATKKRKRRNSQEKQKISNECAGIEKGNEE